MNTQLIGANKWELDTPVLCLDADALERNVERMALFLRDKPAGLRPHSKTHKSPTIAWLQLRAGAVGITCAKLGEAEVLARAGIRDILVANQIVGPDKIARLVNLAAYSDVMVAVESATNADELSAAAQFKGVRLRVLLEVDTGMHRCGTAPGEESVALARHLASLPGLRFEGIMGYEGHAVMIPDWAERKRVAEAALQQLVATRDAIQSAGIPVGIVSAGGTGTYAIAGCYEGITEIQAGSYATMDAQYQRVGIDFEAALTLVARVIGTRGAEVAIIDAGLKALTSEFGMAQVIRPTGWVLERLAEEHGFLRCQGGAPLRAGDRVELVPSHGCTTINLHDAYWVTRRDLLEAVWPIEARGCLR